MKKLFMCIVTFIIFFSFTYAKKVEVPEEIAVGLSYGSNAVSEFTVYAKSGVKISDVGTVKGTVTIKQKDDDKLLITTTASSKKYTCDADDGVSITPASKKEFLQYNDKTYRGSLIVYRFSDSDLTVVNLLKLDEYLYGVVPREIATGHPTEALRAQAVVARSYAAAALGKYKKWNFDVTNSTSDQAYGGYDAEKEDTNEAVDDTSGEVIVYDGKIVSTPFFSTSGGMTEDPVNVWGGSVAYLKPVEDTYQSENASYANWTETFSKEKIEAILKNKDISIGDLLNVIVVEKSDSDNVIELKFVGTKDEYTVKNEKTRTFLGLKSQTYDIESGNNVSVISKKDDVSSKNISDLYFINGNKQSSILSKLDEVYVLSNKKTITYNTTADEYIINGRGWGHGVGMSQTGAIGMAKAGFDYEEIIEWYYTGVKLQK